MFRSDLDCQLYELARERERALVVGVVDGSADIGPDMEHAVQPMVIGKLRGMACESTTLPSTDRIPVPPLPRPGPSYFQSTDTLKKWDELDADSKKLFIRQANVYGAFLAYTDHEIGRVIQEVEAEGKLDNTLIIYISGDNGASPEGTVNGLYNEFSVVNAASTQMHLPPVRS